MNLKQALAQIDREIEIRQEAKKRNEAKAEWRKTAHIFPNRFTNTQPHEPVLTQEQVTAFWEGYGREQAKTFK